MDMKECILTRRSVRKFTAQPVEKALFEEVISLAAWAPSWKNTQITRYTAITDRAELEQIARDYAPFNAHILETAPLLVALSVIKGRSGFERDGSPTTDRGDSWQMFDCGIAAQTLCLAGHEKGLGSVILGIFDRPGLEKHLNIPPERELVALVAMGYPADQPAAPRRKPVDDLLEWRGEKIKNNTAALFTGQRFLFLSKKVWQKPGFSPGRAPLWGKAAAG